MNDFNKGIEYAFKYLEENITGRVVNGLLEGVLTREELRKLKENIPKKCDFCVKPCKTEWCCTKKP